VRCMDLDPFVPVGIAAPTLRLLDIFLLHCLLQDSPPDTPEEIAALGRNQHRTASHGREPGLKLERGAREVFLVDWGLELLQQCEPIAAALDGAHASSDYSAALDSARLGLAAMHTLPSARVLSTMKSDFAASYTGFIRAQSTQTREQLMALPWPAEQQAAFEAMARESIAKRRAIEAADTEDFETFRLAYLAPERLVV
jgi:glutamate--cysteine ligase